MAFLFDPVTVIAQWINNFMLGIGLGEEVRSVVLSFLGSCVIATAMLVLVIALIIIERKLAGRIQGRFGPNRVGPDGIFQTIPDMIKIFTKEFITPDGADLIIYNLAPILVTSAVLLLWAVIPYSINTVGADLNVGVLYLIAIGSLATLGILMAGWSSNNKYALLGALRTVAQMISYEVPMVIILLIPVIFSNSMGVNDIIKAQHIWYVIVAPLATIIFFISAQAEVGRSPFDLLEAESELVAGFHIEYSGLRFGFFYVAEFLHSFTFGAIVAALFLGGWRGPGAETYPILGFFYFSIKAFLVYFVAIWVRLSMPRVRIDQLMDFGWKFLIPVSLVLVLITAILEKILLNAGITEIVRAGIHLAMNVIFTWITIQIMIAVQNRRPRRVPVAQPHPVAIGPRTR